MRVFLPALQVGAGLTGVGTYTLELIRAWAERDPEDLHLVVGAPDPEWFGFLEGRERIDCVPLRLGRDDAWGRMLANHTVVPQSAEATGADVVLAPNFVAPLRGRFERVTMVHDFAFVRRPETTTFAKRSYYRLFVRQSIRRSARVLVSTRFVADEIAELVPGARERVRIAPEGVGPTFLVNDDEASTRARSERRDGLLFVGTLEPRKNLARILAAHSRLCRADADFPPLRLIGGKGWVDEGIERAIATHSDPRRLERLGYCTTEALRAAYDRSLALVFPSLYEGFGLPVLEAMARGCPVITSRGTATEEVAGAAALLVDPVSTEEIEGAMARLVHDAGLRRELAARGRRRVREFSWDRCASATIDALRELTPRSKKK